VARRATYLDPDTGVLVNLVSARTDAELSTAEHDLVIVRHIQLWEYPLAGAFDLAHLKAIHRFLFGDVYPFAGEARTVDLCKVDDPGRRFVPARLISACAARVFADIAADNYLRDSDRDTFVDRITHHFVAINHLHPFREGNGRTSRLFLCDLAVHAGYRLDWTLATRAQVLAACRDPLNRARQLLDRVTSNE
jgi:cell filamentation protein, protein adenylyltransferase